ncbi:MULTISPECIES: hypothetical protein [Methylomicrobium]|nr:MULTISPECIES: hypothetical protein [Methylomicrobium]
MDLHNAGLNGEHPAALDFFFLSRDRLPTMSEDEAMEKIKKDPVFN